MDHRVDKLWKKFHARLLAFVSGKVKNKEDAEDLLQDVFLKISKKIDQIEDEDRLAAWMYQITRNAVIDCYRTCYRVQTTPFDAGLMDEEVLQGTGQDNLNSDIQEYMKSCITLLPDSQQAVIRMHEYQGLTHIEIAKRLGISPNTSKSRLMRARLKLQDHIEQCCRLEQDQYGNIINIQPKAKAKPHFNNPGQTSRPGP